MGMRMTKLKPLGGFCAETAAAVSILGTGRGGNSRFHNSHNCGRNYGRGQHPTPQCGTLGSGQKYRLGLGPNDSRFRIGRSSCFFRDTQIVP
jgi:hypothetical protein